MVDNAGDAWHQRLVVAAIDIGTTYSGYAFSLFSDKDKPEKISVNPHWTAGSNSLLSLKTPTCVLLNPDASFNSFGFEAEDTYSELCEDNKQQHYFFFRRFKMTLYSTEDLSKDTLLFDISGKEMPALTIFAYSIEAMKKHLLDTLRERLNDVKETDVNYVITVPAIWNEKAKQFMIMAAKRAGIDKERIRVALEPEAASIWGQVVTEHERTGLAGAGAKYLIVDLGGGTADITAHEKLGNGALKELYKATGGAWGGNEVDKGYIRFLEELVGLENIERFRTEQTGDYFGILRDFEVKKRTIKPDMSGKITFKIPASLREIVESEGGDITEKVAESRYREELTWVGDKLRIPASTAIQLFDVCIEQLVGQMIELFAKPKLRGVNYILLVGGFAECKLVKDAFRRNFRDKELVVPADAGLAVLKGAVRFGYRSDIIESRMSRYAYGREAWPEFNAEMHEPSRKTVVRGKEVCRGVFRTMVKVDEEIPKGKVVTVTSKPISVDSVQSVTNVYSSEDPNEEYVDGGKCTYLGKVVADLPTDVTSLDDKKFDINFEFGGPTIKVKVFVHYTEKTYETEIQCLEGDEK